MPAATANQAKWLHSQSCRRPRPIPIGRPPLLLHMPHLTWHFVQLVCVSINLLSLSLASRIWSSKILYKLKSLKLLDAAWQPWQHLQLQRPSESPRKWHQFFHYVVCLGDIAGQLWSWGKKVGVGCINEGIYRMHTWSYIVYIYNTMWLNKLYKTLWLRKRSNLFLYYFIMLFYLYIH